MTETQIQKIIDNLENLVSILRANNKGTWAGTLVGFTALIVSLIALFIVVHNGV